MKLAQQDRLRDGRSHRVLRDICQRTIALSPSLRLLNMSWASWQEGLVDSGSFLEAIRLKKGVCNVRMFQKFAWVSQ